MMSDSKPPVEKVKSVRAIPNVDLPAEPSPAEFTPPTEPQLSVRTYIETSAVKRKEADILRLAHPQDKLTRTAWDALAASYKGSEQ